jgi:hypothetical protein
MTTITEVVSFVGVVVIVIIVQRVSIFYRTHIAGPNVVSDVDTLKRLYYQRLKI